MTPNEILIIRNQMIKDIKNNQTSLVISDAQSYMLEDYSWALEESIINGNIDLTKYFLNLNTAIKNFSCLSELIKKANCLPIFSLLLEKDATLKEKFSENLNLALRLKKMKVVKFIINDLVDFDSIVLQQFLTKINYPNSDPKLSKDISSLLPIICKKISLNSLDDIIEKLEKFGGIEQNEKKTYLLNWKLNQVLKDNTTKVKKIKL